MPILNKFKFRTPFEEFENYLGEEMNAFSGFFMEELKEENDFSEVIEKPNFEEVKEEHVSNSYWLKLKSFFNFFS